MKTPSLIALALFVLPVFGAHAAALGSAFTYQGRLTDNGQATSGRYDVRFGLYDAESGGNPVRSPVTNSAVIVAEGLFTTAVEVGTNVFDGTALWLEIAVRTNGSASPFVVLDPRQPVAPTPYALYAPNAGSAATANSAITSETAASVAPGGIGTPQLADGAVTGVKVAGDAIDSGKVLDGSIAAADVNANSFSNVFWKVDGNGGTTPGVHFLGTTDNQPLELRADGRRLLRLEPNTNYAANVIFGDALNSVAPGVIGSTVGGGGGRDSNDYYRSNSIGADWATISGGGQNVIGEYGVYGTIGGGGGNVIEGYWDNVISGGGNNSILSADYSVIGGGSFNRLTNMSYGTISGGHINRIEPEANFGTIGGGYLNTIQANGNSATIAGGRFNANWAYAAFIGGGWQNLIDAGSTNATIGGGYGNTIQTNSLASTIGGGTANMILADAYASTIGGGDYNLIDASAEWSTIAGGQANVIATPVDASTIGGGQQNWIEAGESTIGGGGSNSIGTNASGSTIGGGLNNTIQTPAEGTSADVSTIGGGVYNKIEAGAAFIGGGFYNRIQTNASGATIPGGSWNVAAGAYSFAAGNYAQALHDGAFVWADSTEADFASTASNQFNVRATGGVRLETAGAGLSIDAQTVFTGGQLATGLVTGASLADGAVTGAKIAEGTIVAVDLAESAVTSVKIQNGTILPADLNVNSFSNVFWQADGNSGTRPGRNFVGTSDNQPLELKANGRRLLRLEPNRDAAPNMIGGDEVNYVGPGTRGATIGGGGGVSPWTAGTVLSNSVHASMATIGGGFGNTIHTNASAAAIGGGLENQIADGATNATIAGGTSNTNSGPGAVIGGGERLANGGSHAFMGGGQDNVIAPTADFAALSGGATNGIRASARYATIAGGTWNGISTNARCATVGGGYWNYINSDSVGSTIGGGSANGIGTNVATGTVAGGDNNVIFAGANSAAIGGGYQNYIRAGAENATIGGGRENQVAESGIGATIPGGLSNRATNYAFAAGRRAKADHRGSFVWADSQDSDFFSTETNRVSFRCQGGVTFSSGQGGANQQVAWTPGSASWSFSSDRNLKARVEPVDAREVLDRVSRLPLSEWNYRGYGQRHIGPMAQDFHALFPLNKSDTMLNSADLDGVALAAIQGLNQKLEERLKAKDAEICELRESVAELKALVSATARCDRNW